MKITILYQNPKCFLISKWAHPIDFSCAQNVIECPMGRGALPIWRSAVCSLLENTVIHVNLWIPMGDLALLKVKRTCYVSCNINIQWGNSWTDELEFFQAEKRVMRLPWLTPNVRFSRKFKSKEVGQTTTSKICQILHSSKKTSALNNIHS